jgi:hypothetical protein
VLAAARHSVDFDYEEVDIDSHSALRSAYNDEIPVICIDGVKAFKYHVQLEEFLRKLAART